MSNAPLVDLSVHHKPVDFSDRIAFGFTKMLRFCADTFFAKRYGHRAIVLETVAAVSVGLKDGEALVDLDYAEDSNCDTDMNVIMTGSGGIAHHRVAYEYSGSREP